LTFKTGGYYKVDITDDVTILALNTMYYDVERIDPSTVLTPGEEQWTWLED